jgi:peptide-methionine (S)-S-oxide reductase
MNQPELDSRFREVIAAFDADDLDGFERLVADHPAIAHQRLEDPGAWLRDQIGPALDGFLRAPYLLWLMTEDAVRTGKLPSQVAAMARAIVERARRDGRPTLQEMLDTTLHFTVCSPTGRDDGRQIELLDALIDAGASLDGAPMQAMICSNTAAAEHLLRRGAPLNLQAAVCLDRWDDVARLAPVAEQPAKQMALALAALNGNAEGLRRLLPYGVEVSAYSTGFYSHATPLHHAVWSGVLDAVKVLVDAGARLDIADTAYGGTPLGWALHALEEDDPGTRGQQYAAIAEYLRGRGARG